MNQLQIINGIECFMDDKGMIQLNLEHVAKGLGFTQVKNGVTYIRKDRVKSYLDSFGFSPQVEKENFIPEPMFYLLAMKAENESAKEFQRKVAYEVLPSIRKHGMYATDELLDNPDLLIKVATALKEEREKNKLLQVQNQVMKPKAEFFDAVADSKDAIEIGQVAKLIGKVGRNKLFEILRENKVLMNNNQPYQKYIDNGCFRVIEQKFAKPTGETCINIKTLVYQKGVDYIRKLVA